MRTEKSKRAAYTLEYKLGAVRLVQGGQVCAVTAKVLGIPKQTLEIGKEFSDTSLCYFFIHVIALWNTL